MTEQALALPWRDRKRYGWLLGVVLVGLPFYGWLIVQATGSALGWWFTPLFVYGFLPLLDMLLGTDPSNPPEQAVPALAQDRYYRRIVYLALPAAYAVLVFGAWLAVRGGLAWHAWLGLAFSIGIVSGVAINLGHELGHQSARFERLLAKLALAPAAYGHFHIEHNRGHHVRVATYEDPASARYGESLYRFYPRCALGGCAPPSRWSAPGSRRRDIPSGTATTSCCRAGRSRSCSGARSHSGWAGPCCRSCCCRRSTARACSRS
jgi:alkane 1-monooxygenase